MSPRVCVFAPATVSNLGPGFDVLGLALTLPGDIVEAEPRDEPGVEVVEVSGSDAVISTSPDVNVAAVAAADVLRRAADPATRGDRPAPIGGARLWIRKGLPLASGLGGSGASSAAGAFAVNELLGRPFSRIELVASAMEGERRAAGSAHADNVAPSLLGGIVLVRSYVPLEIVELPVPPGLVVTVARPHCRLATSVARALLDDHRFGIADVTANVGNVAALVAALFRGDLALLGRAIDDRLVAPLRASLIPGFTAVQRAALDAGALGCSISGAGPSVFALSDSAGATRQIGEAMRAAFRAAGLECDLFVGPVNTAGAAILDCAAG